MQEAERFRDQVDTRLVSLFQPAVRALMAVHPVRIDGLENLPSGAAVLVGNHGLLGYETALFFERIYSATGRLPRGCADRWFFKVPLLRDVLVRVGGMYGCPNNAARALSRGDLVVCYPGGAREVFKHDPALRYKLQWQKSRGFARVAVKAGVPIVPFAAAGVDHTFNIMSRLRGTGRLLMGHEKYDLPLLLPPVPSPVPFWFRIGEPIEVSREDDVDNVYIRVWNASQRLLDGLVSDWRDAQGRTSHLSVQPADASVIVPAE
jgi:1-acyl-sn-glycerol-3-phosphate acyltransferase